MKEQNKSAIYLNLVTQAQAATPAMHTADRLTGGFAETVFEALDKGLTQHEIWAAIMVGHYFESKKLNAATNFDFLFRQLAYWQAVFSEATEFWANR